MRAALAEPETANANTLPAIARVICRLNCSLGTAIPAACRFIRIIQSAGRYSIDALHTLTPVAPIPATTQDRRVELQWPLTPAQLDTSPGRSFTAYLGRAAWRERVCIH